MKILDRYVLISFLLNYVIAFMVLVGLYVVLDMAFSLDEWAEFKDVSPTQVQQPTTQPGAAPSAPADSVEGQSALQLIGRMADFYFHHLFVFFVQLAGVIPVAAAAFTLIRMSRFNELVAFLAAGVPLLRLALPIILAGVVLTFALPIAAQELVIPNMIPQLMRKHDQAARDEVLVYPIMAMQDNNNALVYGARYFAPMDNRPAIIIELDVVYRDESLLPAEHLRADRAIWNPKMQHWDLENGRMVSGLLPDQRPTAPVPVEVYKSNITPEEIALYKSSDTVQFLSTSRINQLLERRESYGTLDLLRVKHARVAQPFVNIIMLLLAIPCVLTRDPSAIKQNAFKLLLLVGGLMGTFFMFQSLAVKPPNDPRWIQLWPALMAFIPVFIFGPLSIWLLTRVKT